MALCIVNYWGLEAIRTDFIAPYCIVPNMNLQGLPKHLNGHPKVSEQNFSHRTWFGALEKFHEHQETPLWKDHGFDLTKTSKHELDPTKPHTTGGKEGDSHPPDPTPQGGKGDSHTPQGEKEGGAFPPTRPHTTEEEEEGRGIPTHQTPHHRAGRRGGDSQSTPPQPSPQKRGGFPDHLGVGWGGAAEGVTIYVYIYIYIRICL